MVPCQSLVLYFYLLFGWEERNRKKEGADGGIRKQVLSVGLAGKAGGRSQIKLLAILYIKLLIRVLMPRRDSQECGAFQQGSGHPRWIGALSLLSLSEQTQFDAVLSKAAVLGPVEAAGIKACRVSQRLLTLEKEGQDHVSKSLRLLAKAVPLIRAVNYLFKDVI